MQAKPDQRCIVFHQERCVAAGTAVEIVPAVKQVLAENAESVLFIFDENTSDVVEIDFRGSEAEVIERLQTAGVWGDSAKPEEKPLMRRAGRPSLGVVAREVTLLPRHWEWLNCQPGGASVALRKLVDEARRLNGSRDEVRRSQESAYRFMLTMAGDLPGYEEATRALFGGDAQAFGRRIACWPADVQNHAQKLAARAFSAAPVDSPA